MRRFAWVSFVAIALLAAGGMLFTTDRAEVAQAQPGQKITWAIVIHGGAGGSGTTSAPEKPLSAREELLRSYLTIGCDILAKGGSALDACERVVRTFEDSGKFNTGKGATSTGKGDYALDAGIMDGSTLMFGAVAGVKTIKNPISTARAVMEKSSHVLLISTGAEAFAQKQGLEIVPPSYFNATQKGKKKGFDDDFDGTGFGTVGCVCLDQKGNLAAATSTGGIGNVTPGRVGDVPICGAGTYANNKTCAVSGTGTGEHFVRNNVAHSISALMEYKGLSVQEAANEVIFKTLKKGTGGVIVVSHTGEVAFPFNGNAMARGTANSGGRFEVGIGKEMRTVKTGSIRPQR